MQTPDEKKGAVQVKGPLANEYGRHLDDGRETSQKLALSQEHRQLNEHCPVQRIEDHHIRQIQRKLP